MTTTLTFDPPAAWINANHRLHHQAKAKLTKAWRAAACEAVNDGFNPVHYDRAHITVAYRFPDNRRRDVQNLQPTSKAIVDGLVDANLIPDDDDAHIVGPDNRRERPNGTPRVTVTIQELP